MFEQKTKSKNTLITYIAIAVVASIGVTYVMSEVMTIFAGHQAFAPAGRRGFMCEYRPTQLTDSWLPYTTETIKQVSENDEDNNNN